MACHTFRKKIMETKIEPLNLKKSFKDFIIQKNHPCVMARSLFTDDNVEIHAFDELGSEATAKKLLSAIEQYVSGYNFENNTFETLIAVFPNEIINSELEFEEKMWKQLQLIHNVDPHPWDSEVSSDPENSKFSFSIAGKAFYIIGMHPKSSRMARQAPFPAMIFNLHSQFEKLREMGVYQRVKKRIRKADEKLQGSINPMLDDFGDSSEARQYSGRAVDSNWKCPFHH